MTDQINCSNGEIRANYTVHDRDQFLYFNVKASMEYKMPKEDSIEHFFKEHELGVGKSKSGELVTYNIEHPHLDIYPVIQSHIKISPNLYGPKFSFLSKSRPQSVVFARGSGVKVYQKSS